MPYGRCQETEITGIIGERLQQGKCIRWSILKTTTMEHPSILRTGSHDFLLRDKTMKRVITYGTFDLLHYGHINLLKRARALGDYLVVAISTDEFNKKM